MKRKIALLVAFVMILSLVPMTVSANVGTSVVPGEIVLPVTDGDGNNPTIAEVRAIPTGPQFQSNWLQVDTLHIPTSVIGAGDLAGMHVANAVMVLSGESTWETNSWDSLNDLFGISGQTSAAALSAAFAHLGDPDAGASTILGGSFIENQLIWFAWTNNSDRANLVVAVAPGVENRAVFNVPITFDNEDCDDDIDITVSWAGRIQSATHRVATRSFGDFSITFNGDVRSFYNRLDLDGHIRITENVPGLFNHFATSVNPDNFGIRLDLERGFAWARGYANADRDVHVRMWHGTLGGGNVAYDGTNGTNADPVVAISTSTEEIRRGERDTRLWIGGDMDDGGLGFDLINSIAGGVVDHLRVGVTPGDAPALQIVSTDTARVGDVRVNVAFGYWDGGDFEVIENQWVTVARHATDYIIFHRYEEHDLEDFVRPSGRMEWDQNGTGAGADPDLEWDSVLDAEPDYHQTATVVLTESVPGVLPFTGLRNVEFTFPQGVQVLGFHWETNEGNFAPAAVDDSDDTEWFLDGRTRTGDLETLITRNVVSIRPEIGREDRRDLVAEIRAHFYISIEPGFVDRHGTDEVEVVVSGPGFEDGLSAVVAYVFDPITVETNPVTIGDGDVVAAGMIRHIYLDDIVIYETEIGALEWNETVAIFVERNTQLDTVVASAINIDSFDVTTDGESGLQVSVPRNFGRATEVTITRPSRDSEGWIRFSNIRVTGLVMPGHEYDITVVGTAVAGNHATFGGTYGGWGVNIAHGFWVDEPYLTHAFGFDGTDVLGVPADVVAPPVIQGAQPRTLFQNQPFTIQSGPQAGMTIFPSFEMVSFGGGAYASAFIAAAAIGDVLGWENSWDANTATGTFFLPDGRVVAFTNGSNVVNVNGQQQFMTNADGSPANATIINDRFMVHIRFFEQLGVNITWLGGTVGNYSLIVTP